MLVELFECKSSKTDSETTITGKDVYKKFQMLRLPEKEGFVYHFIFLCCGNSDNYLDNYYPNTQTTFPDTGTYVDHMRTQEQKDIFKDKCHKIEKLYISPDGKEKKSPTQHNCAYGTEQN